MNNYITLLGSEEVQRAVSTFDSAVDRLGRITQEFNMAVDRLEVVVNQSNQGIEKLLESLE